MFVPLSNGCLCHCRMDVLCHCRLPFPFAVRMDVCAIVTGLLGSVALCFVSDGVIEIPASLPQMYSWTLSVCQVRPAQRHKSLSGGIEMATDIIRTGSTETNTATTANPRAVPRWFTRKLLTLREPPPAHPRTVTFAKCTSHRELSVRALCLITGGEGNED